MHGFPFTGVGVFDVEQELEVQELESSPAPASSFSESGPASSSTGAAVGEGAEPAITWLDFEPIVASPDEQASWQPRLTKVISDNADLGDMKTGAHFFL